MLSPYRRNSLVVFLGSAIVSPAAMFANAKQLTEATMNQKLLTMEYAVRGKVVIAADKISSDFREGRGDDYPFDHIIYTNIGNPHSVGQKPLTWPRQVLALADLPAEVGVDHPQAKKLFPADAISRAREIKEGLGGHGTGAYSHSQGALCFREDIASFLQRRDATDTPSDPNSIFITNGASSGIQTILTALLSDETCGVMIPTPQYPIYSATIDMLGGQKVGYYLDEENNWDLSMQELERSLEEAKGKGIRVNSFVLINPGNPTGQVLSESSVQDVVKFCAKHNLVLLADEVYQENIYDDTRTFVSCKKAALDTGLIERDEIEMVSFHSTSKGLFGECGRRGGYMELVGIDSKVKEQLYKLASASLCSTVTGQIMTSLMVRGPEPSGASYASHVAEKAAIFRELKKKSKLMSEGLNGVSGISCQPSQGAMYCFPSVTLPEGALEAAKEQGIAPDAMYAISLLERTGICVVPASGFGQEEGRFGFRTTFLPVTSECENVVNLVKTHHEEFVAKYA